jgi:hypothetical protein
MSEHETYDTDEARRRALRRLSGALGRHVTEAEVRWTASLGDLLVLESGEGVALQPGNVVYRGEGRYLRNGQPLTDAEVTRL